MLSIIWTCFGWIIEFIALPRIKILWYGVTMIKKPKKYLKINSVVRPSLWDLKADAMPKQ